MDIGAVRSLPTFTAPAAPRAVENREQTTQTDLPIAAAVRPSSETEDGNAAGRRRARESDPHPTDHRDSREPKVRRRVDRDDHSNSFVYRDIDTQSGEVVQQIPTDTLLKLRAYVATMNEADDHAGGPDADTNPLDRTA